MTEDVDFYEHQGEKVSVSWIRSQIEGTSDFSHGSWFWTNVSGGLNYQVGSIRKRLFELKLGGSSLVSLGLSYALS